MNLPRYIRVLLGTCALISLVACEKNPAEDPDKQQGAADDFARVLLLEQFTSDQCVNCPNGVAQIDAFLSEHTNVIWLSHHAGYGADEWTIAESNAIARLLGVSSAPSVALDRSLMKAKDPQGGQMEGYNLHPYYLNYLSNLPTSPASASVRIENTYDAGKLHIRVSGKLKSDAPKAMRLSVVIKENGLHGKQLDPQHTLAGAWEDYVHANVIRSYVSTPAGDSLVATNDAYEVEYDLDLNPDWVADNCMVVAFLTDAQSINVVQAAEKPVVDGTRGGADLPHGGVTPKAVPDGYPEGPYSMADFIKDEQVTLQFAQAKYNTISANLREWHIMTWTTAQTYGGGQNTHLPFADIIFFTDATQDKVPATGEWDFTIARSIDEVAVETAWAGYCDIEAQKIIGSELLLVNRAQFEVGNIAPGTNGRWLIAEGKITFAADGFEVVATSATGKPIHLKFSGSYRYL